MRVSGNKLFRAMQVAEDGKPLVGTGDYMLGVRKGIDVKPDAQGLVHPGKGMSVTPNDASKLPPHLRPDWLGGFGELPVFSILLTQLEDGLQYHPDPRKPDKHGTIDPSRSMSLSEFQATLAKTRASWEPFTEESC